MRIGLRWWLGALFCVPMALAFVPGLPAHGYGFIWLGLPVLFWFRDPGRRRRLIWYVVGIALQTAAYPGIDLGFLGWVLLWPYLIARRQEDGASWWRAAYLYGFLRAFAGFYWLGNIHYAAWIGVALGSAALFVLVFELVLRTARCLPFALRVGTAWALFEWVHSWFLGGFPWLLLAHTQYRYLPLIQAADLVGACGLGFLIAFFQAAVLEAVWMRSCSRPALVGAVLVAAVVAYGMLREGPEGPPGPVVLLVQTAIPQEIKESDTPVTRRALGDRLMDLTARGMRAHPEAKLIVWPETMYPWPLIEDRPLSGQPFGRLAGEVAERYRIPAVYGASTFSNLSRYEARRGFNSAVLIDAQGRLQGIYRKQELVPMGEEFLVRRLLPDSWCSALFDWLVESPLQYPVTADLERGKGFTVLDAGPGLRCAPLICFEGLHPGMARAALEAGPADLILHLVNNGWFGHSWEQGQALAISVFRAVETRTPFLSCANGGISCAVGPGGAVLGRVDGDHGEGTLAMAVPRRWTRPLFLRGGKWILPLLLGLLAGLFARRAARASPGNKI